jgi:O-antigen ligase
VAEGVIASGDTAFARRGVSLPLVLLCVYAFHAGLGIETPIANFVGNFGIGELALMAIAMLLTLSGATVRINLTCAIPLALGILSTMSWTFSVLLGPDNFDPDAWGYVLRWFTYALLLLVLPALVPDRETMWKVLGVFAAGVVTQIVVAWGLWSLAPRFQWFRVPLLASETFNANTIGFYLSCGLPVLMALAIRARGFFVKLALTAIIGCFILSAFTTSSKATWGTVALIFGGVLAVRALSRPWLLLMVAMLAAGGYVALTISGGDRLVGRLAEARWSVSQRSNLQRVEMAQAAAEMASDYPLLGAGPKAFQAIGARYGRYERDPHNAYVGVAAEVGLVAGAIFVLTFGVLFPYYIVSAAIRARRLVTPETIAFAGFLTTVLLQGFVTGLPASDKASWLMLGLAAIWHSKSTARPEVAST